MENVIMMNNGFGSKIDLFGVVGMVVEQLGLSSDTKNSVMQELYSIKQGSELAKTIYNEHVDNTEAIKDLVEYKQSSEKKIEEVKDFADCLFNHADAKRTLENYIHRLTYRHTGDPVDMKDKLFHATLTRSCKGHISKSLNVSNFDRVKVSDVDTAKKLAECHMTSFTVEHIISETIKSWQKQKTKGTLRNKVANDLLDKYLEQESQKYAEELERKLNAM